MRRRIEAMNFALERAIDACLLENDSEVAKEKVFILMQTCYAVSADKEVVPGIIETLDSLGFFVTLKAFADDELLDEISPSGKLYEEDWADFKKANRSKRWTREQRNALEFLKYPVVLDAFLDMYNRRYAKSR